MSAKNIWLIAAGGMSLVAGLAHLACIVGGTSWYLFLGAPRAFAYAAGRGELQPALFTAGLAIVILAWAAFAFSAAGMLRRLPLTKTALVAISFVLILRGASYFIAPLWSGWRPDLSPTFMFWSSLITLVMGMCFALGAWQAWPQLSQRN